MMPDYKEMYSVMVRAAERAIREPVNAQHYCEDAKNCIWNRPRTRTTSKNRKLPCRGRGVSLSA